MTTGDHLQQTRKTLPSNVVHENLNNIASQLLSRHAKGFHLFRNSLPMSLPSLKSSFFLCFFIELYNEYKISSMAVNCIFYHAGRYILL